jgi:ribonuclease HI
MKIQVYTDGAARGNPGPAGWGAVFLMDGKVIEIGGRMDHATNNIMELSAPIGAMKFLKDKSITGEVEIISDSKYVILGITEWIAGWLRNNWRNAAKKPVANKELWEELYELNQEFKPKWTYVKGHSENEYNERADVIATSFADEEPINLKK